MREEHNNQVTSSRKVVIRDINALLQTAPISRIKTLRDDEGRSKNVGQVLPDNKGCSLFNLINPSRGLRAFPDYDLPEQRLPARGEENGARGFTLIELLVVVLIIGILAAVALPQYQKAVERSKATQALSVLNSLSQAYQAYYLEHGTYATKLDDLPLTFPWTGKTKFLSYASDAKSNDDWALEIENHDGYVILRIGRISGKYKGSDFHVTYENPTNTPEKTICCCERTTSSNFIFDASLGEGAYCVNVMHGKFVNRDPYSRWYSLP